MLQRGLSRGIAALATVILAVGMSAVQAKSSLGNSSLSGLGKAFGPVPTVGTVTNDYGVAGINSWDLLSDSNNEVYIAFLIPNAHVVGIGWDVGLSTIGLSWLSEAVVQFGDTAQTTGVNLTVGVGDSVSGSADYSSGGVVDLIGLGLDFSVGADGVLRVEFFESFDDNADAIDANWTRGTISVQYAVPEPSTYAMLLLGLAGIAVVVRRRRA